MTPLHRLAAALFAAPLLAGALPAGAGTFADRVFAPGAFEALAADAWPLDYRHSTETPGQSAPKVETVTLAPGESAGKARLLMRRTPEGGDPQPLSDFAPGSANPVLLFFLESTTRAMAEATGGSPFYIRNRIREALGGADLVPAGSVDRQGRPEVVEAVTLTPFAADPNRGRMGSFADLTLVFRLSPDLPGGILDLSADTPGGAKGYHERLMLVGEGAP